jgi:hypothetical protein
LLPEIENAESICFCLLCSKFGVMAVPQDFEAYGAAPQAPAARSTMRPFRVALVACAVALTMCAALVFLVSDAKEAPVEDLVFTPEERLSSIVTELAEHGATMSLKEMEAKLDAWRKDPSTLLDLPENARTQVTF